MALPLSPAGPTPFCIKTWIQHTHQEDVPKFSLQAHSFASGTESLTQIHSFISIQADQLWWCWCLVVNGNNMRSSNFLFFALCSVFSLSAAQTASSTLESTAEATSVQASTVGATTGAATSPSATVSSGGGTASNGTTSVGGGTGTTSSASSSSTQGPPDVLLKVPNLSVKRIEYATFALHTSLPSSTANHALDLS